jgi:hypothetical protein
MSPKNRAFWTYHPQTTFFIFFAHLGRGTYDRHFLSSKEPQRRPVRLALIFGSTRLTKFPTAALLARNRFATVAASAASYFTGAT